MTSAPDPKTLDLVNEIGGEDSYLAIVSTIRADGTPHSSLVNAGLLPHPVTGETVAAFVTYGPAKLAHLRARPSCTLTWRAGWRWVSVDGDAVVAGPDDALAGFDAAGLPQL